ncbi:hypothetical protein PMAYCL1PPCAC_29812, partial [Pristionchus mayeri]
NHVISQCKHLLPPWKALRSSSAHWSTRMVAQRDRHSLSSLPYSETASDSPSMSGSDEERDRRQKETIQKALRLPKGKVFNGEYWPPIFTEENVRSAKGMLPRKDDVFIVTYPKCGTTWIQHISHQLLGKTEYEAAAGKKDGDISLPSSSSSSGKKAMCFVSPMIERMGAEYSDTIKTPRVLKSHFTYANIPKGGGAKYIFAVRNPKDCLTSYFHHNRNFKIYEWENGDFDVFFDLFMSGQIGFGDYFDHLNSWLEGIKKGEENILFLKYEDMVADLRSAVIKIANFLGGEADELIKDEQKLERIVCDSSLSSMKKNQERWFPNEQLHRGEFIRKGGSRDWKNQFTFEQSQLLDKRFRERCSSNDAAEWWKTEMAWNDENVISPSLELSSDLSSFSSYTSGFYSASPLSLTSSSLDFSSSLGSSRLPLPSLNSEGDLSSSPSIEHFLNRDRGDSLQFQLESLKGEEASTDEDL